MRRLNSEGFSRDELLLALQDERAVRRARHQDLCLLCRSRRVNTAGLCEGCNANLTEAELEAARPWIEGRRG